MNLNMWKNHKGTAKSTFRKKALKLYGYACECCGIKMCEWHHLISKSKDPKHWIILCPTCHSVITRRFIKVNSRDDIQRNLVPFIKKLYQDLRFNLGNDSVYI
ncbi:MAG: hypothetical protein UX91_C0006G0088 [Candidatus Amesbacteria bacterium GW2011_GWB1_47_19]|nr:MAG: hypothetical protein UW51_C0002G0089 [Candidatus Amesbacteria bacterium GW2011_GWA1_44_24]KKU31321.1 MAG: hypothetical protein UX46_C0006G0113 [Candidatus Amesbacteria bacterium GW2011_GWC1_46_24]KKU67026.1 MAG: hypothetical protein UX91_C0006G0088 [Candidatus Amesbacteria bacterium GW2011_GWB1_47_19]